jgi:GAF domain-containing protein
MTGAIDPQPEETSEERILGGEHTPIQTDADLLRRFLDLIARLPSITRLDDTLQLITDEVVELVRAETGSLLLLDQETNELVFEVATGRPGEEVVKYRIPPGHGVVGWVVDNARPVMVSHPQDDPRFYGRLDAAGNFQTRSILAAPLITANTVIGVLELVNAADRSAFDEGDMRVAVALAALISLAIDNASMHREMRGGLPASYASYRLA